MVGVFIHSFGGFFYEYASLPSDYYTCPDPDSIDVAFNRESDITAEHGDSTYYRFSVDKWQNYVHSGFESSNTRLKSMLSEFRQAHSRKANCTQLDEHEVAFIEKRIKQF